jgi:peptidoglycan/LPS O-acetylase OafA/YrhL
MKEIKFAIAGLAVLGIIGAFLPIVSEGPLKMSLWDVRAFDAGQFWLTMGGLIVALLMAGLAVVTGALTRWQAVVATLGFALAAIKVRDGLEWAIGGKLMLLAAAVGLVVALVGAVKPEPQRRIA